MDIDSMFAQALAAHTAGQGAAAEAGYRKVLARAPNHVAANSNLARVLRKRGQLAAAIALYRRAAAAPDAPAAVYFNLGNALGAADDVEGAADAYTLALTRDPGLQPAAEALGQLRARLDPAGLMRLAQDQLRRGEADSAVATLRAAAMQFPDNASVHQNLAYVYKVAGHYRKALSAAQRAQALDPSPVHLVEIGNALLNLGEPANARATLETASSRPEGKKIAASAQLMALLYDAALPPRAIREAHMAHVASWSIAPRVPAPAILGRAPLHIGFVTPDLHGDHPVGQFMRPLLAALRVHQAEAHVTVFDSKRRADRPRALDLPGMTVTPVGDLDDAEAAATIRAAAPDVLIDLSGHTNGHRLEIFSARPAPVQASYLGYPSTTGHAAIDFLIVDHQLCPPGSEPLYSEALARLPDSFVAFAPPAEMPVPQATRVSGPVRFGSLNHLPKLNGAVIDLWAEVLRAVPGSRLVMQCAAFAETETISEIAGRFAAHGVDASRLDFHAPQPFGTAMARYHSIDIALDPFPYNGGTTSVHALHMGVPVVSLVGDYFCGRMGASILTAAGSAQDAVLSRSLYVERSAALAHDVAQGVPVRAERLARNASVALFDVPRQARSLVRLLREISG